MTSPPRTHLRLISGDIPGERARPTSGPASLGSGQPAPLRTAWTADELMAMHFPEPRWAVPGILAEGVSLFAGPPKVGKSWLSLGVALAVASGSKALDAIPTQRGPVLYLALEDTPRRLQSRMRKILAGQPAPSALTLVTSCPTLPDGGEQAIARWLDRNPDARMVAIDVFAKIRGTAPAGLSAYDADYHAMSRVKRLADTYGVAVLLVHHVRKMGSDDFLNEVSGTNGLAGAADATLVLKRSRGQADGVLHVTGRDVDEADYALSFQPAAGLWHLLDGSAEDHTLSDTRAAILRHVRQHPDSTPKQIAGAIRLSYDNVKKTCQRMASDGQLSADAAGRYHVPAAPTSNDVPAVPEVSTPLLSSLYTAESGGHPPVPAVTTDEESTPS